MTSELRPTIEVWREAQDTFYENRRHTEAAAVIASALEAARREALEQAVEKLDGIYREMCGQHGADSGEAGAAFYARKTIYELKENTNG